MTSPWVRGSLVRNRGGRGAGSSSFVESGPIAPNVALLTPHSDGTLSLTDRGTDGVTTTTTRATSGWIQQYDGTWTLVGAGVPRIMGARYDSGTYYYTDGSGNELRPTRTVTVGGYSWKHFDSYKPWEASESGIAIGDRRLPLTRSGNAAAVTYAGASPTGFYYECTAITTGTCDGTEPAWPETLTNTVVDGGVTWTCQGLYTLSGAVIEQAATNSILQSRAFTTTWTTTGTPTSAQTEVGFDASANTAWVLGDDNAAQVEFFKQPVTITADTSTHLAALLVKKDSDETRFPRLQVDMSGGTAQNVSVHLNTKTGATATETYSGAGAAGSGVVDLGDWWWLWISVANVNNTTLNLYVVPAGATVLGTSSAAATGTAVFDHAQLYLNTSTLPATPGLATTTAAATRNADVESATEFLSDTAGTLLVDVQARTYAANARIVGGDTNGVLESKTTDGTVQAKDGTNTVEGPAVTGQSHRHAMRWTGSALQVATDGTANTAGSYDGGWNNATNYLGSNNGSNAFNGTLLNLVYIASDIGATDLATATARDAT